MLSEWQSSSKSAACLSLERFLVRRLRRFLSCEPHSSLSIDLLMLFTALRKRPVRNMDCLPLMPRLLILFSSCFFCYNFYSILLMFPVSFSELQATLSASRSCELQSFESSSVVLLLLDDG